MARAGEEPVGPARKPGGSGDTPGSHAPAAPPHIDPAPPSGTPSAPGGSGSNQSTDGGGGYVVDPAGLKTAAQGFDGAVDAVRKAAATLTSTLEASGEAWGTDSLGKGFAEGKDGYKAQRDGMFEQLKTIGDRFDEIAKSLRSVTGNYGGAETQAVRRARLVGTGEEAGA